MSPPGRVQRQPVDVDLVAVDDLVLVADSSGVYYGRVRGRSPGGFAVAPLDQPGAVRKARAVALADHWQRAPRRPAVPADQLRIPHMERG